MDKPKVSENLVEQFRNVLSPGYQTLEYATATEARPCSGCSHAILIGQQMIVTHGKPLDPQYYHQRCYRGEHKK